MNMTIGDYKIETDNIQFIVKSKKITEEGRMTKEENVGKETWKAIAYPTTFDSALKFIPQQVIRDNNDISVIKDKLEQISADIKAVRELPIIVAKIEKDNGIDIEEIEGDEINE